MAGHLDARLTTTRRAVNGIELHLTTSGPSSGPLVVLLHGFPDAWWTWRGQIGPLADAGYQVVVPDLRGYNCSDKPHGVRSYSLDTLAADVLALVDGLGRDTFRVVGHDWGGVIAWETAIRAPGRIEALAVLDAPHPDVMRQVVPRNPSHVLRSSYVLFFQLPWLPEAVLRARDFAVLRRSLVASSAPGTLSEDDLDRYADAWRQPGSLTGMLSYYRALRHKPRREPVRVSPRTLVVWGGRDRFLSRAAFHASLEMCDDGSGLWIDEASHWLHLEQAGRVANAIVRFFQETTTT